LSEVLTAERVESTEQGLKSFDVLASVKLYQYDLETLGYIQSETKQRVYDEELSYIAEGINQPNFTEFVLNEVDGQLVYFHQGQWQPYISTLIKGLKTAEGEAASDYRKNFEVSRRADDLARGYQVMKLEPGQKMHWFYDFPEQQQAAYGPEFLESMGFQPKRKLGYLCEAEKTLDGRNIIRQQSVDNSDNAAFEAAMLIGQRGGTIDQMREAYDEVLSQKNNQRYYAGRSLRDELSQENAWSVVVENKDLIEDYFLNEIEKLAAYNLSDHQLEAVKKRLTYGVWAALKERLDMPAGFGEARSGGYGDTGLHHEVSMAYDKLAERGETLFGCGGAITGERATLNASPKDVFNGIFGGKREKMNCPFCGASQYGDPCSSNQLCTACEAEVKNGKIVSKGKGRPLKIGFLDLLYESWREFNQKYEAEQAAKKAERLKEAA
jgi:hypothetical protein